MARPSPRASAATRDSTGYRWTAGSCSRAPTVSGGTCSAAGLRSLSDCRVGLDAPPADAATTQDIPALRQMSLQEGPGLAAPLDGQIEPSWTGILAPQPTEPLLVILVEFTPDSPQPQTLLQMSDQDWANAFFGTIGKTVRTYYDQASRGTFHFAPAPETAGTPGDGIVRVQLEPSPPEPGRHHRRPQSADRQRCPRGRRPLRQLRLL